MSYHFILRIGCRVSEFQGRQQIAFNLSVRLIWYLQNLRNENNEINFNKQLIRW